MNVKLDVDGAEICEPPLIVSMSVSRNLQELTVMIPRSAEQTAVRYVASRYVCLAVLLLTLHTPVFHSLPSMRMRVNKTAKRNV